MSHIYPVFSLGMGINVAQLSTVRSLVPGMMCVCVCVCVCVLVGSVDDRELHSPLSLPEGAVIREMSWIFIMSWT